MLLKNVKCVSENCEPMTGAQKSMTFHVHFNLVLHAFEYAYCGFHYEKQFCCYDHHDKIKCKFCYKESFEVLKPFLPEREIYLFIVRCTLI